MNPGKYDKRIDIDAPSTTQGSNGEELTTWDAFATVWAKVEPLHGREALLAGGIVASIDTRFLVRWSPNLAAVTSKWRIRYGGKVFDIVSPPADIETAHREIEIMATTGVNEG